MFAAAGADKAHPQCRLGSQDPGHHTYAQKNIFNSTTSENICCHIDEKFD